MDNVFAYVVARVVELRLRVSMITSLSSDFLLHVFFPSRFLLLVLLSCIDRNPFVHGTFFMAAARFIRFFSRRQTKNCPTTLNEETPSHTNSKFFPNLLNSNGKIHTISKHQQPTPIKNGLVCTIVFLDGDDVNFEVDVSSIECSRERGKKSNRTTD